MRDEGGKRWIKLEGRHFHMCSAVSCPRDHRVGLGGAELGCGHGLEWGNEHTKAGGTGQGGGNPQSLSLGACGPLSITLMGAMWVPCHLGTTVGCSVVSIKAKTKHCTGFLELVSKAHLQAI